MSSDEEDPYKRLLGTLSGSTIQSLSKKRKLDVADDSSQSLEAESYSDSNDEPQSGSDGSGSEDQSIGSEEELSDERGEESEGEGEEDEEEESHSSEESADAEGKGEGKEGGGEGVDEGDDEEEPARPEEPLVEGSQTSAYLRRFSDRPDKELQALMDRLPKLKSRTFEDPELGRCTATSEEAVADPADWHPRLVGHVAKVSPLAARLLPPLSAYSDVFYPGQTPGNRPELLHTLALHVVNHCLLAYAAVTQHNGEEQPPPDQGFTKPKVLVLMPFKNSCLEFVQAMAAVLPPSCWLGKKKQFLQEFGPDPDSTDPRNKPADWYQRFHGNIDEDFRIGISLTQSCMKLYSSFYASDIIIASPLGLRRVIGVQGEESRDWDFLSSIEVLVLDQAEVFLMQNFDHVQIVLENLNLIPRTDRGADITRLRSFNLNEWAKYLRQTILLSAFVEPELSAVFSRFCSNTSGLLRYQPAQAQTISDVVPKIKQVFQRIESDSFAQVVDAKLAFFRLKVLPNLMATNPAGLLIFTSSYLEYLSLRNLLHKEEFAFDGLNEYSNMREVSRVRTKFFQGRTRVVLYTERSHFYNRFRLRGVASVFFFSLPAAANFYPELLNLLGSEGTATVLFSKWEYLRLTRVVGRKRADLLLTSDKAVHLFC